MRSILVAIRQQLHVDQGLERNDAEAGGVVNGGQVRRRQGVLGANLFPGKKQMNRLAK
jgi:hypothetical protein